MYHLELKGLRSHIYLLWDIAGVGTGETRLIVDELCIRLANFVVCLALQCSVIISISVKQVINFRHALIARGFDF